MSTEQIFAVTQLFSCESKVSDLRAMLETYRFDLLVNSKLLLSMPVHQLGISALGISSGRPVRSPFPHTIRLDPTKVTLLLARAGPPPVEGRESFERWPFWTESTITLQFLFHGLDGLTFFQEFLFEPGQQYEDRVMFGLE